MTTAPTSLPRARNRFRIIGLIGSAVLILVAIVLVARSDWDRTADSRTVVEGSGTAATETREVARFTSVDLAGSNNVSIAVGGERSIRVHADDNLLASVTTRVRDGELVIDDRGSFRAESPMSVDVTVPVLDAVTMSGSGTMRVEGVGGASLSVALSGSGVVRVSGYTDRLQATLDGSGDLFLDALTSERATAVVSGSGSIRLSTAQALDASVSGSGTISYAGDPSRVTKEVTGSGAIVAR